MQILLIGFGEDNIHPLLEAISLRLGYLLSNELRLAGNYHTYVKDETDLKKMRPEDKIKFINTFDSDLTDDERKSHTEMGEWHKQSRKILNKPKHLLVSLKVSEKKISEYFDAVMADFDSKLSSVGLTNLEDLSEKPGYGFYNIFYKNTEQDKNDLAPLSKVLLFQFPERDLAQQRMLFLNYLFFYPEFITAHAVTIPALNEFTDNGFLVPLINTGLIATLSVADIDIIKNHVHKALTDFQHGIEHFISLNETPEAAYDYLQTNLKLHAATLQEQLDNTPQLTNYLRAANSEPDLLQLVAGMLPWKTVYEYYKFIKVVKDETAQILDTAEPPQQWVPVIIVRMPDPGKVFLNQRKAEEVNQTLSVKKSLLL